MKMLLISPPGWPKGRLWGELAFRFPSLSLIFTLHRSVPVFGPMSIGFRAIRRKRSGA